MTLTWLPAIRLYIGASLILNFVWEFSHMPLYTLWVDGTALQILMYGLHCTIGDLIIACIALTFSLIALGSAHWPQQRFLPVATSTVFIGFSYTLYSEWHSITVSGAWAYRDAMPTIFEIGVTPLLQWIVIPMIIFYILRTSRIRQQ